MFAGARCGRYKLRNPTSVRIIERDRREMMALVDDHLPIARDSIVDLLLAGAAAYGPLRVKATVPLQLLLEKQPARTWKVPVVAAVNVKKLRKPHASSLAAT
jgi:hypothetical protein